MTKFNSGSIKTAVGQRLELLSKEWNLNREGMAKHFGLARMSYYKNEIGENFPRLKTLHLLSTQHDIAMDWFIFGKGPRRSSDIARSVKRESELEKQLEQKTKEYSHQLEAEKKRADEAEARAREAERLSETAGERFIENLKPGVKELLEYIDNNPTFYHKIILHFEEYRAQHEKKPLSAGENG